MSLTKFADHQGAGIQWAEFNYTASGTNQAINMSPHYPKVVLINEVDGGGAGGNEIGRVSGLYAVMSGCVNATKYRVNVLYI